MGVLTCIIMFAISAKYLYDKIILKDKIIYIIKDTRKSKYIFLILGYIFLLVFLILSFNSQINYLEKIIISIILLETFIFWTIIELSNTLLTSIGVYKLYNTNLVNILSYEFKLLNSKEFLILNLKNSRKIFININSYDKESIVNFFQKYKF